MILWCIEAFNQWLQHPSEVGAEKDDGTTPSRVSRETKENIGRKIVTVCLELCYSFSYSCEESGNQELWSSGHHLKSCRKVAFTDNGEGSASIYYQFLQEGERWEGGVIKLIFFIHLFTEEKIKKANKFKHRSCGVLLQYTNCQRWFSSSLDYKCFALNGTQSNHTMNILIRDLKK